LLSYPLLSVLDADVHSSQPDGPTVIERHYKTRELAELLGVHPETIRRAAQRGELESIRIGLDRIYAESAVQKFLAANLDPAVAALNGRRQTRASSNGREAR
jgi:excisionase family DNA binding protein